MYSNVHYPHYEPARLAWNMFHRHLLNTQSTFRVFVIFETRFNGFKSFFPLKSNYGRRPQLYTAIKTKFHYNTNSYINFMERNLHKEKPKFLYVLLRLCVHR